MLTNIARLAATNAHAKQTRRFTGEPYINHPQAVVNFLQRFNVGEQILAAAWCHDVLEDCGICYEALELCIGTTATDIVFEVTNKEFPEGTPRIEKYWHNIERLVMASHQAQTLKCGDIYDNCKDVYERDQHYGAKYIAEKYFLIRMFARAQSDVRQTVMQMLHDRYLSMTPDDRMYCLEYMARLDKECPADLRSLFDQARKEAGVESLCCGEHDGATCIQNA
ncbi:hypothetical protein pEaSNUABM46_00070 [Erwinia phage pEa_SNUABM_46]|nr:hypothetical protein pEaSNUABM45_00070 [Erwinia phage pEa_SNUABM_45]QYW04054.1 hypothetical protein pEaSNUABM46_00070 [Erwinia phage pEa_SNUABM_46]